MVRSFSPRPVPADVLERLLRVALSGPSAGFAQGIELVVLDDPESTASFWDISLPSELRVTFPWPGLLDAPVLTLVVACPETYVDRYGEDDKFHTGLGFGIDSWPVPYWYVDAGIAVGLILLAAVDEGLGALFFGAFERGREICSSLGVPEGHEPVGVVALGYPSGGDRPSRSSRRGRRPFDEVVHRGRW